jgi:type I restriction enzyme S subunit
MNNADDPTAAPIGQPQPAGWAETTIGEIAEISSGFGFPERFQGKTSGQFPFAKVRDISAAVRNSSGRLNRADNFVDPLDLEALRARPVRAGSTVFAKIGEALRLNRRAILDVDAILDNNCMAATPDERAANPEFLYRFFTTVDLSPFAVATTVPSVRRGDVLGIPLHLPPLGEQRRIVAKIDGLSSKSKRARDQLDYVPRLVEKYKQAILAAAFRMPPTESNKAKDAPNTWSRATVSDVASIVFDGPFGSNLKSDDYSTSGVRVVRLENIGHLRFIGEKETFVPIKKYDGLKRHTLEPDDVLFSSFIADEIRVCLFPRTLKTIAINKADCFCIRVEPSRCLPRFLTYQLASRTTFEQLKETVHGATRPRISLSQLRSVEIALPTLIEQDQVVGRIEAALAWIDRLATEATSARKLIDRLDRAVLAKAFQGELVPQDPRDKPASTLLECIRAECAEASATPSKRIRSAKR